MTREEVNMPSDSSVPPEYSPKVFPPLYTPVPQSSESTLQRSSSAGPARIAASGYFVRRQDGITLLLHDQDGSAARPSIGPGAFLEGRIILELTDRDTVRAVELKIEGWIESLPLPGAHSSVRVVSISKVLYSPENGNPCANSLPFSHRFPSIFNEGENVHLLPPTCQIEFNNTPFFMKCTYRITARVVAQKHVFRNRCIYSEG
ncbi:hypothetical protein FB45DRAFT_468898 [Roridomyces roridus]|uniref:Uncharacterized protein n=1 Tax=Roridomyces roridus TaxID=1738132 RepID=A0AAD7BYX7_9AGAR|nr:hypothetical protein FB45DRAFT_468898 [Roridomyces roridus]